MYRYSGIQNELLTCGGTHQLAAESQFEGNYHVNSKEMELPCQSGGRGGLPQA